MKQNETKRNKTKQNETKRNKMLETSRTHKWALLPSLAHMVQVSPITYSGHIQWDSVGIQGTFSGNSGNIQWEFREHSWNVNAHCVGVRSDN
jgi:hypothetical protein